MDNKETVILATSYSYHPEKLSFSETDETTDSTKYFYIEKTGDHQTKLTVDIYLEKSKVNQFLFNLFRKKKLEASFRRSLVNLETVVREIKLPPQIE
ncbi:MAG: hypothetical protein JWM28_2174, partial [Chitinophagaceae bacterium]|nr:hypothetical protein [Chitinophagaceae bacterium]